jgi:PhnB protein
MNIEPYLFFEGRCEEAIEFYRKAAGAEVVMLMRFRDSPETGNDSRMPADRDKIMHASFRIGDTTVGASDGSCLGQATFKGFSLALKVDSETEAERLFNALGDGGTVHQPLIRTFFASRFGMVADRFGVGWMVLTKQ